MKLHFRSSLLVVCVSAVCALLSFSQSGIPASKPGRYTIQIFHVVPGKAVEFLRFNAEREAIRKEAGAPPKQWFRHSDGADWDYISITPLVPPSEEEALQEKIDTVTKQHHLRSGAAGGMELRALLLDHSDTISVGPMTAEELLKEVE